MKKEISKESKLSTSGGARLREMIERDRVRTSYTRRDILNTPYRELLGKTPMQKLQEKNK